MESQYIEMSGGGHTPHQLHVLTHGDNRNPAVFCVHGLTCLGHDFDYLAQSLAHDFYVIAPDMPGRGHSDYLSDISYYSNEYNLQCCLHIISALAISSVHWVGASMGGIIGMMACTHHPALVQSLMMCDVGAVLAREGLTDIFLHAGQEPPTNDNGEFEAQLRDAYSEFHFTDDAYWQHFFTHRTRKDAEGNLHLRCDPAVMTPLRAQAQSMETIEDVSLEAYWQHVSCPVLLFRGAESRLLRADTARQMRDAPQSQVILHEFANVGHMPNLYETEQIALIHQWLLQQC